MPGKGGPSYFPLGSVITVFTWISKYITWTSKQYPHNILCGYWIINVSVIHVSIHISRSWKFTFPVTSKPTPRTVFNLHASNWVHCEEKTSGHTGISQQTYKLVSFFKVFYFAEKNIWILKKSVKFIIYYNWKRNYCRIHIYLINVMITSDFQYLLNPMWSRLFLECPRKTFSWKVIFMFCL